MDSDARWCPHCKLKGERRRQKLLQINNSLAVLLCENDKCVNLGKRSLTSSAGLILERKASEIPNSKRRKGRPVPTTNGPATKTSERRPSSGATDLKDPPGTAGPDRPPPEATGDARNGGSREAALLGRTVSAETMPRVRLWRNKGALCWLDACLAVLVSARSLRACLSHAPGTSLIRRLCVRFAEAQEELASDRAGRVDAPPPRCPATSTTQGPAAHNPTADSNDGRAPANGCPDAVVVAAEGGSPGEILDGAREELFQHLRPLLRCDLGRDDSPVLALPLLLHLDRCVEEHFKARYRWEFYCMECSHTQITVNKKSVVTLVEVPADFSLADPVMLHACPKCNAPAQRSHLVFHSFPACVVLHFQDGFPVGDLSGHHRATLGKDVYSLSAVVRYRRNPDHFVTLIRDGETNRWLEYDDLSPSPFSWGAAPPQIPAGEIHLMAWERSAPPCIACRRLQRDADSIRESVAVSAAAAAESAARRPRPPRPLAVPLWSGDGAGRGRGRTLSPPDARESEVAAEAGPRSRSAAPDESNAENVADAHPESADASDGKKVSLNLPEAVRNAHGTLKGTPKLCLRSIFPAGRFSGNEVAAAAGKSNPSGPTIAATSEVTKKSAVPPRAQKRAASKASTVLGRIPKQLFQRTRVSSTTSRPRRPGREEDAPPPSKAEVLSRVPRQLQSGAPAAKPAAAPRPIGAAGSRIRPAAPAGPPSRAVALNPVAFRPYGQAAAAADEPDPPSRQRLNAGTLTTWQKRLGRFSASASADGAVAASAKRPRRGSLADAPSNSDPLRPAGPPYSAVPSPSTSSEVSSLSDTLSLTSSGSAGGASNGNSSSSSSFGRSDLAATIDELCKVLDISSEPATPSVSSRLSSPSQDMFLSELMADDATWAGLDDQRAPDPRSSPLSLAPPPSSSTTSGSEFPRSAATPGVASLPEGDFGESPESFDFFQALLNDPIDQLLEAPSNETAPSVGPSCPAPVQPHCSLAAPPDATALTAMPPSCARLPPGQDLVAGQPNAWQAGLSLQSGCVPLSANHMASECGPLYNSGGVATLLNTQLDPFGADPNHLSFPQFFNGFPGTFNPMGVDLK